MPCHHLVERLSARHRVFYVNNFGALRDLGRHDLRRILSKVIGASKGQSNPHVQVQSELENITIWQPWLVPTPRVSCIQKFNAKLLQRSIQAMYKTYGIERPIIWTRLPTPIVYDVVQRLERQMLIYQSIDKYPEHPRIASDLRTGYREYEQRFNQESDLVFCSARGLLEEKRVLNKNAYFVPNGVASKFSDGGRRKIPEMEAIEGPVVGFAGALGTATSIEWLVQLAQTLPAVQFVFVGTVDRSVSMAALECLDNVHLMGLVPHADLISWFEYFDIGLMPYRLNHYQYYTFPSKLAEYLMGGLPIVARRLPELEHYQNVVSISDTVEQMAKDIEHLLSVDARRDVRLLVERKQVANTLTWEAQIETIEAAIMDTESKPYA